MESIVNLLNLNISILSILYKFIKYLFLLLLPLLLGIQITYAKTTLASSKNQNLFSIEQNQSFTSLKKEVQPNIGFLKGKSMLGLSEGNSVQKQRGFSVGISGDLANGVDDVIAKLLKNTDNFFDVIIHSNSSGEFVLKMEEYSEDVVLSSNMLADIIKSQPTTKSVRLLSCNSEEAAMELSSLLGDEVGFYACDGYVDITKQGIVTSQNKFYKYNDGNKITQDYLPLNPANAPPPAPNSNRIRLGVAEAGSGFGRYSTRFDDFVDVIQKESLFGDQATTFLDAEYRTVKTTQSVTAYRAFGGDANLGGSFVATTQGATRSELALLDEWNNTMRFEAKIIIPEDVTLNIGKVGPQTSSTTGQHLTGGADQVILPFQWNTSWVDEVTDLNTGRIFNSVDEFESFLNIENFLNLTPNIDNIPASSLPTGYQIVNKNGSKYIRRLDASDVNTPRLMVDETGTIVPYVQSQRLSSNATLRNRLKQANGGVIPTNHQAHHIVPNNVIQNSAVHQEAINRGLYDIDRISNGKLLAETAEDYTSISDAYPTHFGSHTNYDGDIVNAIDDVLDINNILPSQIGGLSDSKLLEIIDDIEGEALGILEDWVPSKLN